VFVPETQRRPVPRNDAGELYTALLGLAQHLTGAELYWFGYPLSGVASHEAIRNSDAAIRAAGDPEALTVEPIDRKRRTLRWVLTHMTSETARHAGQADILREQLDGTTGR
jgi:hypothetical protein